MSKRKPNNTRARVARSLAAMLRSNHVAVVNIDPEGRQGMVNWKNCKSIPPSRAIADAVCDHAHRWAFCIGAFCVDQFGASYIKFSKVAPAGIYLASHLEAFIEAYYRELMNTCNPRHVVGSGWIATPYDVELTDQQAELVFDACGAWRQN